MDEFIHVMAAVTIKVRGSSLIRAGAKGGRGRWRTSDVDDDFPSPFIARTGRERAGGGVCVG